ncbi:MAG: ABC transporter, partial [Nocardioides sp.]
RAWGQLDAGRGLLATAPTDLGRASRDLRRKAERAVRDWQADVLEMVRSEGADKRTTARFLAYGVNGLSVALMMVVFASTAGLTGAEVGIAGGSAVVGQKLLEAVFGDQAVRTLAERARASLETSVSVLFAEEAARYATLVDALGIDTDAPERLRQAARRVDDARFAAAHEKS